MASLIGTPNIVNIRAAMSAGQPSACNTATAVEGDCDVVSNGVEVGRLPGGETAVTGTGGDVFEPPRHGGPVLDSDDVGGLVQPKECSFA